MAVAIMGGLFVDAFLPCLRFMQPGLASSHDKGRQARDLLRSAKGCSRACGRRSPGLCMGACWYRQPFAGPQRNLLRQRTNPSTGGSVWSFLRGGATKIGCFVSRRRRLRVPFVYRRVSSRGKGSMPVQPDHVADAPSDADFDQLPIPFVPWPPMPIGRTCIIFRAASWSITMRASMSVPGAIAPYQVGDRDLSGRRTDAPICRWLPGAKWAPMSSSWSTSVRPFERKSSRWWACHCKW